MTLQLKPKRIFGQKPTVLMAIWQNLLSWFVRSFAPSLLPRLLPKCIEEDSDDVDDDSDKKSRRQRTRCISIGRPGGVEQLRQITLRPDIVTCGYNVCGGEPFANISNNGVPSDCVVLRNEAFSVNYADCCIRYVRIVLTNTRRSHQWVWSHVLPMFTSCFPLE